jgi:hypothetical protein
VTDANPGGADAVSGAEVDAAAVDAVPIDAAPVDAAPVDAAPVDAAPVDAAPVDAAPVDAASDAVATSIQIVAGNPSAVEIAAVTAVLTGVLEELAGTANTETAPPPSAWSRAQRPIRQPIFPAAGRWRSFSG